MFHFLRSPGCEQYIDRGWVRWPVRGADVELVACGETPYVRCDPRVPAQRHYRNT